MEMKCVRLKLVTHRANKSVVGRGEPVVLSHTGLDTGAAFS